jgi:hypothetical protein
MQDMRTYVRAVDFMTNERMFEAYPELLIDLFTDIYRQDARPKKNLVPAALQAVKKSPVSMFDIIKDVLAGGRAL